MNSADANITHADIRQLRQEARQQGWGAMALSIFEHEPVLAAAVANRWCKIRVMLEGSNMSEEQSRLVLQQVSRLMVEGIGAVQRSGRRLWDDFLPGGEDGDSTEAK